ncbi:MAG: DEAD/DEAH box helicase [Cyclobacteriaceae bacterium]
MSFEALGLHPKVQEGIDALGFKEPTPIQQASIPIIKSGKDLIGSAQTGTGKTAAFLLPILDKITRSGDLSTTQCIIVVPTRELAVQIDQQVQGLSYFANVHSIAIYGGGDGDSFSQEKKGLTEGAPIIIATPGRFIAHLTMNYAKLDGVTHLVLDEADRMLDMGFYHDIMKIISFLPKERQNLLFSATMPPKMRELCRTVLKDPEEINIAVSVPAEKILQVGFVVYETQKIPLIEHILTKKSFTSVIVFCSTKDSAKKLFKTLKSKNVNVADIHSDLAQKDREDVMNQFKAKKLSVLVATDILSRGIDIEDIELVINYDVPNDGEDYIHRIGRTARAASKGAAFTFISEKEQSKFADIESLIGRPLDKAKIPEWLGEAPAYNPSKQNRGRKSYKRKR